MMGKGGEKAFIVRDSDWLAGRAGLTVEIFERFYEKL